MKKDSPYQKYRSAAAPLLKVKELTQHPRLIILTGNSEYLINKTVTSLKKNWLQKKFGAVEGLESESVNAEFFDLSSQQGSLFDEAVLYVASVTKISVDLQKALTRVAHGAHTRNCFVLVYSAKSKDWLKKASQLSSVLQLDCPVLPTFDLPQLVHDLAQQHKVKLSPAAIAYLIEVVGDEPAFLENELRSLSLLNPENNTALTPHDLAGHLPYLREDVVFKVSQAILERKFNKAHLLIHDLLRRGESSLALLGLIARLSRQLLQLKAGLAAGTPPTHLNQQIGIPSYQLTHYTKFAQYYNIDTLEDAHRCCMHADRLLKSSRINPELILGNILASFH